MSEHPKPVARSKRKKASQQLITPNPTASMLNGDTFVVSDLRGDMDASPMNTQGLFSWDTRQLSRWQLTIDGVTPTILATDDLQYHSMQFFLVPTTGTVYIDATLSLIRTRTIGKGFHEQLCFLNHDDQAVDLDVQIEVGADFADIFEIKDALQKKGYYSHRIEKQRLILAYQRERFKRETWIDCSSPVTIEPNRLHLAIHIEPQGKWITDLDAMVTNLVVAGQHIPYKMSNLSPSIT